MKPTQRQKVILQEMPHFIVIYYQRLLDAKTDRELVETGLKTFELILRLLTIILISQYLHRDRERVSEPVLNERLTKKLPIGDLADWLGILTTAFMAYRGRPDLFFIPDLYDLYWDRSNRDNHRPNPSIENLLEQMVAWNNDLHASREIPTLLPKTDEEWSSLARKVMAGVEKLLVELDFLREYELLRIVELQAESYVAESHKGLEVTPVEFPHMDQSLQPNWYYLSKDRQDFLWLDPLLTSWQGEPEETAVFRRLTLGERLSYRLIHAQKDETSQQQSHLTSFLQLLEIAGQLKRQLRPSEKSITWLQLSLTAQEISDNLMASVSDKYDRDVYLQRNQLLRAFKQYMRSDSRCFVLTGRSGAGKSNFVLSLREEYRSEPDVITLMIDAGQIQRGSNLRDYFTELFREYLSLNAESLPDLWEAIDSLPRMNERRFVLIIDAINENEHPQELLQQVDRLLRMPRPWLRTLITSRPEAWRRMSFGLRLAEAYFYSHVPVDGEDTEELPKLAAYNIAPFDWEELQKVYTDYQKKYKLKTSYDELSVDLRQVIRDPLQLWMVASAYEGSAVPSELARVQLVDEYIKGLLTSFRLYQQDLKLLQNELVPLMAPQLGAYRNRLTAAHLQQSSDRLLDRVLSEGKYSTGERINESFQRLADAQIVVSRIEGIDTTVFFKYERFFDRFVGEHLYKSFVQSAPEKLEVAQQLISDIADHPFLWGAVEHALYRTFRTDPEVVKTLAFTESLSESQLVSAVLQTHAGSNAASVKNVVNEIINESTNPDSKIPQIKRLHATETALRVADDLGDESVVRRVLLCKETITRDTGVKYVYYMSKRKPKSAMAIVSSISDEIGEPFLTLDIPALQSTFRVLPLLLLDCYQDGELASPIFDDLIETLKHSVRQIRNKRLFQLFNVVGKTWLTRAGIQIFMDIAHGGVSRRRQKKGEKSNRDHELVQEERGYTVNSALEFSTFFDRPDSFRRRVREALRDVNRERRSLSELSDMIVELHSSGDRVAENVCDFTVDGHGIHAPHEAEPILWRVVDEVDEPSCTKYLFAYARWFTIMERQKVITLEALGSMRRFVTRWYEEGTYGYGVIRRHGVEHQYFPLMGYGALWNKARPGEPIDLLEEYFDRAMAGDEDMLFHIIDAFGDLRIPLHNYRVGLRVLSTLVHEKGRIRDHLVKSLGSLHALYPEPVEHFLVESEAPRELIIDIRSRSFQKPSSELYLRFSFLISDVVAYGPIEFVESTLDVVDSALSANSLEGMVATFIGELLDFTSAV